MDFLLECIGFPPDYQLQDLIETVRSEGEPIPWRGPSGEHLRRALAGGLEVRAEREEGTEHWSVWPYFAVDHRLRLATFEARRVPDSPFDRLLVGVANPALPREAGVGYEDEAPPMAEELDEHEFLLSAYVTDARRLPRRLPVGHVLALSVAGFAIDVSYVGPNEGAHEPGILERPRGAMFRPLGGEAGPGGCMEVSLRVRSLRHLNNPLTGVQVEVIEADAPGRPMSLFLSRWQLEEQGLPAPRPGWRVEGTFLFQGRIAGGLPRPKRPVRSFG
ncbi:MAG: hypothetical protein AAF682_21855 [Planctomycetota bacterium]